MKLKSVASMKGELLDLSLEEQVKYADTLSEDDRKSVQALRKKIYKLRDKQVAIEEKYERLLTFEREALLEGYRVIAGIDEAGRGPLAGPVVAACVVLDANYRILGLDDSKKLSEKVRDALYDEIMANAISVGVGIVHADRIDEINILEATKEAMKIAIGQVKPSPDYLLIDAVKLKDVAIIQNSMYKGDQLSNSIAAASVIAKVTRDRMMCEYDVTYSGYGFTRNKGYGTSEHYDGIRAQGMTPIHRRSFLKSL